MGPGTAVLSILVVAGIYWGLKNGSSASVSGFLGGTSKEDDVSCWQSWSSLDGNVEPDLANTLPAGFF